MTKGIEEFEQAFRRDPGDVDAFAALQRFYQDHGRTEDLAQLLERRATHLRDGHKAADLLWRAAEVYAQRADAEGEIRVLSKALEQHRGHKRALDRMKELSTAGGRWVEVLRLLSVEADALNEAGGDPKRLARIEHELGQTWEDQFHRLDRAIHHYQAAFKAEPGHVESIEAGRRIYRAVGRWKTVAGLYQVELSTCADAKRKVELLLELGELQWEKLGDLEGAARSLSEASQLRPGDESILESLGEIYASPEWPTPGGLDKAASIFMQIAQNRQARGDRDGAIAYLRRALGADAENEAAYNRLEKAYEETGRWEDLDRLYRQRLSVATEMESVELLMRRGELLERKLGDRKGARECYESVLAHEPLGGPASNRLMQLYRADKDYDKLVELHQRALDGTQDRATRIRLMMEISTILRENLHDPESAAHLLHEVLQIEPEHRKALTAYEDYFRQKGDYRNLSELLRFAAQSASQAGAPPMEICARLEELADVSERHLGDLEGAIEAWQQIARLHPDVQRSKEALGRLGAKLRMWQGMVNVLERELAQAMNPAQRLQALHRMAQVYYDKKADPQRTIAILRELLQSSPHDENALRMLVNLYERESDFEGLAWSLESKLQGIMTKAERVNVLRRLGEIHAEKLERPKDALRALGALLELAPTDTRTHDRIQAILEKVEDLEQLARALELRSQSSRSMGERLKALKDLARLMDDKLDDPGRAAAYWEELRAQDADDKEALEALSRLYDRMGKSQELLAILQQRLELCQDESPMVAATILRQVASVAEERLSQDALAAQAYEQLLEILPGDREAMEALARLYARLERHSDLVQILGRQIEVADDPEQRVVLAFKQGDVLEEKLSDLVGAAQVYERIIAEHAPGDLDAHRKLKHLYRKRGDLASACEIAERELFLTPPDAADRLSLSLEIASLWRETVKDDSRATLAYERVLELDPDNPEALHALRRLYHRIGSYHQLVTMAPALFASLTDPRERQVLLLEIAQVFEVNLNEPESAFEWYRRAHDLYPDDGTAIENLRRLARGHGLWEELIAAHLEARKRARSPQDQIEQTRHVAGICLEELGDPGRAFQTLAQGLRADPTGAELLPDLEQLADAALQHAELLEVYDRVIATRDDPQDKRELMLRAAEVAEHKLQDPAAALGIVMRLYGISSETETLELIPEIERLAQASGQWEQAIGLHGRRFLGAGSLEERVEILAHVAALLEQQVGDLGRAFMVYLHAFNLQPDSERTVQSLWRLAGTIDAAIGRVRPRREAEAVEEILEADLELMDEGLVIEPTRSRRPDSTIKDPTLLDGKKPPPPPAAARRGPPPIPPVGSPAAFAPHPPEGFSPWHELAAAYLKLPAPDAGTRIRHLLAVAELWSDGAQNLDNAVEILTEAATIDIEQPELEQKLLELAFPPYNRFDQLVQIYRDALERAADAETLIRLNLKLGDLLAAHGRHDDALASFGAVLAIVPAHQEAADRMKQLLRQAERWQELAELEERQLEVLSDALTPEDRRARLGELADINQHTLNRPLEAIEFLARLAQEDPQNPDVLLRLADLYEEVTIWARLIETLEAAVELTDSSSSRANHLLRVARTYEQELELPDRAIEAYQRVLAEQPHNQVVLEALERLYEAHERHADLLGVLRLQVELAEGHPEAARSLMVRLAGALEQQGSHGEAAHYLQQARAQGPRDPDIEEALARILVQTGRPTEAVQLIQGLVEAARQEGRPAEEIAALMVRLARLQETQLGDFVGARAVLEEALALQPRNAEALGALADFFLHREEWDDYVETLFRLAEVTPQDQDDVVPRLMSAAVLVSERLGDRDRAVRLGELVLQRDPAHLPAVNMLIKLSDQDLERKESFLRLKRDLVDEPREKAQTLTALGRVLHRRGASPEQAATCYHEALELCPDLVPAIDALSELLLAQARLEPARILLVETIERLGLSKETGPLYYRLGQIFERLGQDEEGFRYLMDALRLDAKNLHLRIAVGQNRFRAQRWREALRHLQEVLDHPEVEQHPVASAEALYTAGRCEATLRRPDRAIQFYQEAIALDPEHLEALSELARAALEASEWQDAVGYLQRQVALTSDQDARGVLLKTLGDLYREQFADAQTAARYYVDLLAILSDEEATRLEVLPHILPTLRQAGAHEAAARAAESLADVMWSEREKRDLLLVAAEERTAIGAVEQAEAHLRAALALDPACLEVTVALCELLGQAGRDQEVIDLLARVLQSEAAAEADTDEQRALLARLHRLLGMVHARLGNRSAAIEQLERSLELTEDVSVRETLVELYGGHPDPSVAAAALQNHRKLLAADPGRADSLLAIARASAGEAPYRTYCFFQALQVLGATDEQGVAFLAGYTPPTLDAEAHYAGEIGEDDRWSLLSLPEVHSLRQVFATLWEAAPALFTRDLAAVGISPERRLSPIADTNLAKVYSAVARALGIKQTALYLSPDAAAAEFQVVCMAPPAVIVSEPKTAQRSVLELRFLLGRTLELTQPAYILAAGLERPEFARLLSSVLRAFHPRHMRGRSAMSEEALEQAAKLRRTLPFKVARKLGETFRSQTTTQFDSGAWRRAIQLSANRVGLALCGDLGTALRLVTEDSPDLQGVPMHQLVRSSPVIRDLFAFSVSDAFYITRVKLGLAGSG